MSYLPVAFYITPLILSLLVSFGLCIVFLRNRQGSWVFALAGTVVAMGVWTFAYLLELLSPTLEQKQFFVCVQYIGITSTPVLWFIFAMRLTGYGSYLQLPTRAALFSMPFITLLLLWTNPLHGLMRSGVSLQTIGPIVVISKTYGPWFWVHTAYSYALLFAGSILLVRNIILLQGAYRWKKFVMFTAVSLPWLANFLYLFDLNPLHGLDLTPLFFPVSALLIYMTLYPQWLAEVRPITRGAVLDGLSDMVLVINLNDQLVDINPAGVRLLGLPVAALVGQPLGSVMPQVYQIRSGRGVEDEVHTEFEFHEGWHELHISPLRDSSGNTVGQLIALRDIRRRKEAELELFKLKDELEQRVHQRTAELMESEGHLRASQARLEAIFNNVAAGICQLDLEGYLTSFNDSLANMLGYPRVELEHFCIRDVMHPSEPALDTEWFITHLEPEKESNSYERRFIRRDGTAFWGSLSISPILNTAGEMVSILCVILDISMRKRYENEILHNALHDALTDLPNRTLVVDRLEQAIQHCHVHPGDRYAVLYLDFDHFKDINDSLGHNFGDHLLVEIAARLQGQIFMTDTVARMGGDEFVILVDESREGGDGPLVAAGILEVLRNPFILDGRQVFITCSIGIVRNLGWYQSAEEVLRDADTAMYRAKMSGRNRYEVFDAEMRARVMVRLEMETGLRRAIRQNEFSLQFQPIVSLSTHKVVGFEALTRWRHPRLGMVTPAEFIPLAEETGLIASIGAWVLDQACQQMSSWHRLNPSLPPLYVAVNISARHFMQTDLIDQVSRTLEKHGLPPRGLVIEITEGMLLEDHETTAQTMRSLTEMGVKVAIDDFGTGYSSLSYLHRFSIHTLKIDRSFVARLGQDGGTATGLEIVRAILAMAREMNIEVVAEGIENGQQLRLLETLDCNFGQGFLISPPLSPEKVAELLENASGTSAFEGFIQAALKQRSAFGRR